MLVAFASPAVSACGWIPDPLGKSVRRDLGDGTEPGEAKAVRDKAKTADEPVTIQFSEIESPAEHGESGADARAAYLEALLRRWIAAYEVRK
jgi:hypothetical protein